MAHRIVYLIVNFGGPRNLEEIRPFLTELLRDREVIRTNLPNFLHRYVFGRVARKRSLKIRADYELIGGRSPIYFDTERIASQLVEKLSSRVLTFHRYLPQTHKDALQAIESVQADEIRVLPLFPQFSYATTGSIARFFSERLCCKTLNKLRWIHSYCAHPAFVRSYQRKIRDFLCEQGIAESDCALLFSAHGLPRSFICTGDVYESECRLSFELIQKAFPLSVSKLSYQSKFGRGEWLRPYTDEYSSRFNSWSEGKKVAVVVPLSFTSDHIETLFEIEHLYLPELRKQAVSAHRCPALNLEPYWIDALVDIVHSSSVTSTAMLVRNPAVSFCCQNVGA